MKKNDIMVLIVTGIVAATFSILLSKFFLTSASDLQQEVEVVQQISPEFNDSDERFKSFFNEQAINPTRLIQISPNQNPNPFGQQAN